MRTPWILTCWLGLSSVAFAQREARVPDPDPELERKTFILPDGFEVNLFASDPMLAKPIQMNFDPDGRLWVASSEVYPQILPGQKANDRVLILEDTNQDGQADQTTIFADGLLIPTGVVPGDGGVYVADSTKLVHFSDPDPETGKARKKRIVLSGFGTEDTHHIIHTFRWGPVGDLHFSQSIYIHSHVETPYGPKRLNAGGVWAYRPRTQELSVLARGLVNSWGTAFDRFGRSFWTDGAGGEGINILVPGMYGFTAADAPRILPGLNPGSPKHCGLAVASGRHLPEDWQGNLLTNDFRGHRVCRFILKDDGSGYQSLEQKEVIRSSHPAFRPIDVAMGPDGAIYIADWYNPIIQHGEVDFRDPRRDKTHGRIWRVTAKGRATLPVIAYSRATLEELLTALESPEDYTRDMAKRVLRERDPEAVTRAIQSRWPANTASELTRLEYAYVLRSLDRGDPALLQGLLRASSHEVRAMTCRLVAHQAAVRPEGREELIAATADPHPQVRLEAVRGLVAFPSVPAAQAIAKVLERPMDRWLEYSVWLALRELAPEWLPGVLAGTTTLTQQPEHLVYALQASGTNDVGRPLLRLAQNQDLTAAQQRLAWLALARLGQPAELALVFQQGFQPEPVAAAAEMLQTIAQSFETRKLTVQDPAVWAALAPLMRHSDPGLQRAAIRLAGLTQQVQLAQAIREQLEKDWPERNDYEIRLAALERLEKSAVLSWTAPDRIAADRQSQPQKALVRLDGLLRRDPAAAAQAAVAWLQAAPPEPMVQQLLGLFIARKGAIPPLAEAFNRSTELLPADTAKVALATARANAQKEDQLQAAIQKASQLQSSGWQLQGEALSRFLQDVPRLGDPGRGEAVYRRAALNCRKCHAIAGAGGLVGPDLSSIGASAPVDYLLESLLLPNAKIKEGYNTIIVTTVEGKVLSGVRIRESKTEWVLRDAEGKEWSIPTADIEQSTNGNSLMPAGLVDPLTRQELLDLTRFLSELGKGAFAATPGNRVRRYEALQPSPAMYTQLNRVSLASVATQPDNLTWADVYSQVRGELALDEAPSFQWNKNSPQISVVRFVVDATTPGPATLQLTDGTGLQVWQQGEPLVMATKIPVQLQHGVNTFTIVIDRKQRTGGLTIDLESEPNSPTRARVRQSSVSQ